MYQKDGRLIIGRFLINPNSLDNRSHCTWVQNCRVRLLSEAGNRAKTTYCSPLRSCDVKGTTNKMYYYYYYLSFYWNSLPIRLFSWCRGFSFSCSSTNCMRKADKETNEWTRAEQQSESALAFACRDRDLLKEEFCFLGCPSEAVRRCWHCRAIKVKAFKDVPMSSYFL